MAIVYVAWMTYTVELIIKFVFNKLDTICVWAGSHLFCLESEVGSSICPWDYQGEGC